ncbi:plasmid mobilization relaxosome protein MobC [Plantibacter sp. MPB07]|uniref:plasmid mobilization relaxosome protein MobC n=1 Tax=Plantibacter sp. MPB07 TaxID=3388853 RepID=UPI0039868EE7
MLLIRVSGKRSLALMNAFDFVISVALGSTLATILLSADVAFAGRLGKPRRVKDCRQHSHRVKLSPEEEGIWVARATAAHVTVPRLLVESALSDGRETLADRRNLAAELFAIRGLLRSVSNNFNQIAKRANTTEELPATAVATLRAVYDLTGRIDEIARRV